MPQEQRAEEESAKPEDVSMRTTIKELEDALFNFSVTLVKQLESFGNDPNISRRHVVSYLRSIANGIESTMEAGDNT